MGRYLGMELTGRLIREAARKYPDQEEVDYETEEEMLEILPVAFAEDSWEWEDLEWIVGWKSKRALPAFKENDLELAKDTVRRTLERRSVVQKVETLQDNLSGVRVPVASALLLFMEPQAYTVLDVNAWETLQDSGNLYADLSDDPDPDEYLRYLGVCHALAAELDVDLRTLDRALWVLGG